MLGHVHASLVEFDTICVNETLLKRFNCSRNIYREWQLRSIVKVVFWQPEQIYKQHKLESLGEML